MTKGERQEIRVYAEQAIKDYMEIVKECADREEDERACYFNGIAKGYDELLDYIMNWMN